MPDSRSTTCEAKIDRTWRAISLVEAKGIHAAAPKRCPVCHGQVMIAGSYTGTGSLKMQHRRLHDGCPLTPYAYSGTPAPHPQALT